MSGIVIDAFEFCHRHEKLDDQVAIADLSRLSNVCANDRSNLKWRLEGTIGKLGHPQLTLEISGKLELVCQCCMEPLTYEIDSQTVIMLARDEKTADEIEVLLSDDDPTEVIVGEERQDVLALVEDEALLSMPLSPVHENCQVLSRKKSDKDFQSPFAVLGELRKKG